MFEHSLYLDLLILIKAPKSRTTQHCQNCSKIKNNTTLSELLQNQEQHNTVRTAPKFNQQIVEIIWSSSDSVVLFLVFILPKNLHVWNEE
jgi:hypothetical protein